MPQPVELGSIVRPAMQLGQQIAAVAKQFAVAREVMRKGEGGRGKAEGIAGLRLLTLHFAICNLQFAVLFADHAC